MHWIKVLHISCVSLSIAGFLLRSWWMLKDSTLLQLRLVKVLPHIVDSLLLVSGVALAVLTQTNPLVQHWLLAKLLLLLLYIVSGSIALKYGRNKTQRVMAMVLAVSAVSAIVLIARNRYLIFS